ncbi:hypothetical protein BH11PSE3_BH11PSE3_07840 [soil metagenome]
MDYMVVISAVVLGLSVLATAAKFLDWLMHSDPRTMVRTTRWMLLLLLLACIPVLVYAVINQQWATAMLIGAGMLIVPTFLKWRTMFAPLRSAFDYFRPKARPFDMEVWDDDPSDPETVRRAAAILEAYVSKGSLLALRDERQGRRDEEEPDEEPMSSGEALEVLGLEPGADEGEIRAAHKRLLRLVHPEQGGSAYLAKRVYQARDALLGPVRKAKNRTGDDERA